MLRVAGEFLFTDELCGEQDGGYSAEVPDGLHSNGGREQNSAMHHILENAQWSGDQLHVRSERLTKEIPATFLKLTVSSIQSSFNATKMSIMDVCRKVVRERNARTVLRFAPKTSHQSNGFVEAVHGHIQGLADNKSRRTLAYSFQQFHLPFHLQFVTHGFVLSRFTVRPDGRTPFQYFARNSLCVTFLHVDPRS